MRSFRNPVIGAEDTVDHGDPFVLKYLDTYYLYHTTEWGRQPVRVHTSRDLVDWEYAGVALEPGPPGHWAQIDLWAPEVLYHHGTFYMYVSATRASDDGEPIEGARRQGLARSDSPAGPFVWDDEPLVPDEWTIDGHPLRDQDGRLWLVYNTRQVLYSDEHALLAEQTGNVVDQLVAPDRLAGKPTVVSFPSEEWEGSGGFYWNEGAWVLKRRGRYWLLYSGGCYRDSTYGVGLMNAPHPRGPWIKLRDNPIFRSGPRLTGPGHPSMTLAPDNATPYLVYHAYVDGMRGRKVQLDRMHWTGDRPVIGERGGYPTESDQIRPPAAVHDPQAPHWVADFWARGASCVVSGVDVDLPSDAFHRVQARRDEAGLRIWRDDVLQHEGPVVDRFTVGCDGEVEALTLCSCLEDDGVYQLGPGESRAWTWGGSGPLEMSLGIRGRCFVRLGVTEVEVTHPPDEFRLFRINAEFAEQIVVRGGDESATVTDLFVAARSLEYLRQIPDGT